MKILPSRRRLLPRTAERVISLWWFVAFLFLAAAACWFFGSRAGAIVFGSLAGLVLLGMALGARETRRLRRIVLGRGDESICTFARAFDCRRIDTAVIRAVYEELQHSFTYVAPAFPFRPADHFDADLNLDEDELEDLARAISHRTRRALDCTPANPFYNRVETVRDLVSFFVHQPMNLNGRAGL
jgi:hypothetical protein